VKGSYRQASLHKFLFGEEPPAAEQHTSEGDVRALKRIVEHEGLRELVSASARSLWDITGQHMRVIREKAM